MSIVYLIGAGPGDPGLLTVRGQQCLESADVVLYDHLVPERLLRSARPDAEKIDVGVAAPQPQEQEAICYLLAEKAREGRTVARLKWGDPLVSHGRPSGDSAAIIYDGTLPTQETIVGSIDEIAGSVARSGDRRAAILVVGRVVKLREHLRWFDARPLFGKRVLVTRPKEQAMDLVERLEAMGAQAIEAPMIRIIPPEDYTPLDEVCARAADFDWIIFSSPTAVDAFLDRLLAGPQDLRALQGVKLCVVGPATAERLARRGLKVDLTPSEFRAEGVVRAMAETTDITGLSVLLPRADIGR